MPKVKLNCSACGHEVERAEKPKPKTLKETKQVYFICPSCGAANLRDGTARPAIKKAPGPVVLKKAEPLAGRLGKDNPGPGAIIEPEKKEITHDKTEERDDSPFII